MTRNEAPATTNYTLSSATSLEPTATRRARRSSGSRRSWPTRSAPWPSSSWPSSSRPPRHCSPRSSSAARLTSTSATRISRASWGCRRCSCRLRGRAVRDLFPDAADGQRRTARAVQAAQRAVHEAAGAAARFLQPEQVGRSHLQNQQRHGQAESVFRAVAGAARQQRVPDDRRRPAAADAQSARRHRRAAAGARRPDRHPIDLHVGQAAEPEGTAVARRA